MIAFHVRLAVFIAVIIAILLVPYFIWHDQMDAYFASAQYQQWLASVKPYAWLIGLALLAADAFLPVPAPPVMATMGVLYGTLVGGIIAAAGSILAGLVGFGIGRLAGKRVLRLLCNQQELVELQRFFDTWGAAGIVASRALPVAPEVLTVLAGIARMHLGRFMLALLLGGIPIGVLLAWAGSQAQQSSGLLLVLTLIPAGLWCLYLLVMARMTRKRAAGEG
ncbi:MAG: VTT domain-containing protein [Planctomycetaceae bacterium]|nr:VTT domain-containing protein [Planctomycetaceae bacterium]